MNIRLAAETRYLAALTDAMHRHVAAGNLPAAEDYKVLITETMKRIDKIMKESPRLAANQAGTPATE